MNQRLLQFISAENISQSQFADVIGVARASVSHVLAGRNKPGYDFLKSLTEHYPLLNLDWLMTGKGKMYKTPPEPTNAESFPVKSEPVSVPSPAPADDFLFSVKDFDPIINDIPVPEAVFDLPNSVTDPAPVMKEMPVQREIPVKEEIPAAAKTVRKLLKVIAFFDDGTFQELT